MSSLVIASIASLARFAFSGSGSPHEPISPLVVRRRWPTGDRQSIRYGLDDGYRDAERGADHAVAHYVPAGGRAAAEKIDRYHSDMAAIRPWHLALLLLILMILGGGIGAALWSVSRRYKKQ
jgi:hypothetical protein